MDFLDGGNLTLEVKDSFERLFEIFAVGSDATIPAGDYSFREGKVSYRSSKGRSFSGNGSVTFGGFFGGNKTTVDLSALWRLNHHLSFDLFAQRNEVSLPGRAFTADVFGTRVKYAHSTRLFTGAFVQYNAATEEIIANFRVNFIHSPLSDIFVVYSEKRVRSGAEVLDRIFTIKVTKLFAF